VFQQSTFWLDGTPTCVLPLPDRAADFGDGVFETLLVHGGKPLFFDLHLERLHQGLDVLSLPDCRHTVREQTASVATQIDGECRWAAMRISVIRSPGPRGYTPLEKQIPRILISVSRIDRDCATLSPAATMTVANIRLSTQPALARIKHLNRLEQVVAATQAQTENVDECFVLDQSGRVISVIAGNLFLVSRGELLTPKLLDCGVAGTRRRRIIEKWAPAIGLSVRQTKITLSDVKNAEEIFYSNSLQTVRPVASLGEQNWSKHTVCEALFQQFLAELK
jgi:4-amino-4-deoxychorismate lyase